MGLVIFPCPGYNPKFKIFSEGWEVSHFSIFSQNLKFNILCEGVGIIHLSISRPNLKFKLFQWGLGGRSSNHVQTTIWNWKFSLNGWRVGHITMPRPNMKFKFDSERWGVGHLSISRPNLKFKIYCGRVGHLSMSSPNLKFKIFSEVGGSDILPCPGQIWNLNLTVRLGGWSSFHIQAKSEI